MQTKMFKKISYIHQRYYNNVIEKLTLQIPWAKLSDGLCHEHYKAFTISINAG